jgi:hypothetical protein
VLGGRNAGPDLSSRAALSFLRSALPEARVAEAAGGLVEQSNAADPPRLSQAECLEHGSLRAVSITEESVRERESAFRGFLDGTQKVQVVAYPNGMPAVLGTVSAAIRFREDRRLLTWKRRTPEVERKLYLPLRHLGSPNIPKGPFTVVDTSAADEAGGDPNAHPLHLIEQALQLVQKHRETLEARFAEAWCSQEDTALFIDGGISGSVVVAASPLAVGIVKSHRTLYADSRALKVIAGLKRAQRSSVLRIASRSRPSVASWYLRIRGSAGQDPLWGLLRIEIADSPDAVGRADEISRWVLAESSPLSLPDGRWDKMAYGVRSTEEFLRAIS